MFEYKVVQLDNYDKFGNLTGIGYEVQHKRILRDSIKERLLQRLFAVFIRRSWEYDFWSRVKYKDYHYDGYNTKAYSFDSEKEARKFIKKLKTNQPIDSIVERDLG